MTRSQFTITLWSQSTIKNTVPAKTNLVTWSEYGRVNPVALEPITDESGVADADGVVTEPVEDAPAVRAALDPGGVAVNHCNRMGH